jgi:uncharacterized membrane protein YcaP (DUF421 family)
MMDFFYGVWSMIDRALGLSVDGHELGAVHMSVRAVVVFFIAIALLRLGNKRFMGKHTAVDVMLGIVFGSVASRAITGNAPFFPTLTACAALVGLHWLVSAIAFRTVNLGGWVKGSPRRLVKDGKIDWDEMARSHVTENDLKEAVRLHGHYWDLDEVAAAYLERDGDISVILHGADATSSRDTASKD